MDRADERRRQPVAHPFPQHRLGRCGRPDPRLRHSLGDLPFQFPCRLVCERDGDDLLDGGPSANEAEVPLDENARLAGARIGGHGKVSVRRKGTLLMRSERHGGSTQER